MATYTWNGQLGSEWDDATATLTNWDGPGTLPIPGPNDTAIIKKTATIKRDHGGGFAQQIQINGGAIVTFASTGFQVGDAGIGGLTVDESAKMFLAPSATMLNDDSLDVIGLAQSGSLDVQTGAEFSTRELTVGANVGANGDVTVDSADLLIRGLGDPGRLTVGENGEGSVELSSSSNLQVGTTIVGKNAGSTGTMIVDDSTWSGANLTIGSSGLASGNVTVRNAASAIITNIAIGLNGVLDVNGLVTTTVTVGTLTLAFGTLNISGGGEVNVVGGAAAAVQGALSIATATVAGLGTINANVILGLGGVLHADLPLDGTLKVSGNIHGTGEIDPVRRFESNGGIDDGITIQFSAPPMGSGDGVLQLDVPRADLGTIVGFTHGNAIDIKGLSYDTAVFTPGTGGDPGVLTLSGPSDAPLTLKVAGDYAPDAFVATPSTIVMTSGGSAAPPALTGGSDSFAAAASGPDTVVTLAPCFCRGTRILTEHGEVPVEELAVGDRVVTLSGAIKPIVWIGFGRDLVTRANKLARPVIVRQSALADCVPQRDLYLTHGHALYLNGALIPVEHLVNHRSILWDEAARVVEYYHIELEDHGVLLADGAPAESYHDAGNRAGFHNARPGSAAGAARPTFAPVLHVGDIVETAWARLFARAGGAATGEVTDAPDLHLVVDVERIEPQVLGNGVYRFVVAGPPSDKLLLRSRCGVPSLLGQSRSDHRPLGVAIIQLVLQQAGIATSFDYDQPQLREAGCYPHEDGFAWTDGDLALPARFFPPLAGPFSILVYTKPHPDMRYPIATPLAGETRQAA